MFRVDLRDLGRGLTYRRLGVLLEQLGPDSALAESIRSQPGYEPGKPDRATREREWTLDRHLLALIADLLASANWQRGSGKNKRPEPIPRPGIGPENFGDPSHFTQDEILAFLKARKPKPEGG